MISTVQEFHYRVLWPAAGHFPGHHRSRRGESGFEFRGHVPLLDAPDPRRLDLHASLRDPFGQWIVRVYSQRKSVPVYLLADLSASMGFVGAQRKLDVVADFTESLAYSACRTGDSFGFIGCDEAVRSDFLLPLTRAKGAGTGLGAALRGFQPDGRSVEGLQQAHRYLSRQRSLVFLLSDFHFPLSQTESLQATLSRHQVIPVVIWDAAEFSLPSGSGIAYLTDPETGQRRLIWLRKTVRKKWSGQRRQRQTKLEELFRGHHLKPLFLTHGFSADAITAHFFS